MFARERDMDGTNIFSAFSFETKKKRSFSHQGQPARAGGPPSAKGHESTLVEEADIEDLGMAERQLLVCAEEEEGAGRGRASHESPPQHWQHIIDEIRCMRSNKDAPVDQMGTHQLVDEAADKRTQRFHCLVAAMISSQTRDSVTAAAMRRLHALPGGLTVHGICNEEVTIDRIAEILKPVGFYRQKAKYLKDIALKLAGSTYNGCIPSTIDELRKLPGVGPKVALLVLWVAFEKGDEGLIVDTNVRRVCCRLGWARQGSNPEQVRAAVEPWLPRSLWPEISFLFVGFGQQVCKPAKPQCGNCKLYKMCPSAINNSDQGPYEKKRKTQ